MKTTMKVLDIFKFSNESKYIFIVELIEGTILIGHTFKTTEAERKFTVKGIGLENKPFDKKSMSIYVELAEDYGSTDNFIDKIFFREEVEGSIDDTESKYQQKNDR